MKTVDLNLFIGFFGFAAITLALWMKGDATLNMKYYYFSVLPFFASQYCLNSLLAHRKSDDLPKEETL